MSEKVTLLIQIKTMNTKTNMEFRQKLLKEEEFRKDFVIRKFIEMKFKELLMIGI